MRVLVIDEWVPYPLDSGKKIRTFNLLAPLAQHHEITYLCYADPIQERDRIQTLKQAGFEIVCVPPIRRFHTPLRLAMGLACNLFSLVPIGVRKHLSRRYLRALQKLLSERDFDLIHCEWTHYAHFLRDVTHLPKFLCSHNVECMQWKRFAQVQSNPLRKAAIYLEWLKMKTFEERVISEFDHIAVVSSEDAKIVKSSFGAKSVDVIPNGVDTNYYMTMNRCNAGIIFTYCASMDAFVNQDAALYFAKTIFPRIREKNPLARFMILGHCPPYTIRNLASDLIIVTGSVDDVRPLLAKTTVSVIPLRIAGGSRLKILESFAAGIPVVSTSTGAEGLDISPGEHLLIADNECTFAAQCIRLLDEPMLGKRLVDSARKIVQEKYDWLSISPLIESAWHKTQRRFNRAHHKERDDPKIHILLK